MSKQWVVAFQKSSPTAPKQPLVAVVKPVVQLKVVVKVPEKIVKKDEPELPKKKRGRPSKADVLAREVAAGRAKPDSVQVIKERIKQVQAAVRGPQPTAVPTAAVQLYQADGSPRFSPGDRVRLQPEVLAYTPGTDIRFGTVKRHDAGSSCVFVKWEDGCADWRLAPVLLLAPELPKKRKYNKKQK